MHELVRRPDDQRAVVVPQGSPTASETNFGEKGKASKLCSSRPTISKIDQCRNIHNSSNNHNNHIAVVAVVVVEEEGAEEEEGHIINSSRRRQTFRARMVVPRRRRRLGDTRNNNNNISSSNNNNNSNSVLHLSSSINISTCHHRINIMATIPTRPTTSLSSSSNKDRRPIYSNSSRVAASSPTVVSLLVCRPA
jgi:hypothetical protein